MRYVFFLLLFAAPFANAQTSTTRIVSTYEGTVNDKYPISLTLTTEATLAYGTLVYKRTGVPIRVVGSLEKGKVRLYEFYGQKTITGIFDGQASAKGYLGTWLAPKPNAKALRFALTQTSRKQSPTPTAERSSFDPTGTYGFSFGKDAATGELYVQRLDANKVAVAMAGNRGAPSYNMATVEKTTLTLRGNQAIYRSSEYGKCTIKLTFFEGGASVAFVDDDNDCGFGNAATVTGNYVKTSSKAPVFPAID